MVALVGDGDKGSGTAEELEGGEHLDALADGHVVVGIAVEEEQGSVYLVGVVERRLAHVQVAVFPRVAVGHCQLGVAVAPVALAPVRCVVRDAGVADGGGEDVGDGLQVLRHKAAVAGPDAAHAGAVGKVVGAAEFLGALDDVLSDALAGGVDVSRRPLLAAARASAGVDDVDDIALCGVYLMRVARLKGALDGGTAAVVVDDNGVFLCGVEVGGQVETALDGVAARVDEVPLLALAQAHVGKLFVLGGGKAQVALAGAVGDVQAVAVGGALAYPDNVAALAGQGEVGDDVLARDGAVKLACSRVVAEEADVVVVLGDKVNLAVGPAPLGAVDGRVEVACDGVDLARGDVEDVELAVAHRRGAALGQIESGAVKGLGAALHQHLCGVGREEGVLHKAVAADECVATGRLCVDEQDVENLRGTFGETATLAHHQHLAAVGRDVRRPRCHGAEGEGTGEAVAQVAHHHRAAVAPSRLTVLRLEDLVYLALFGAFGDDIDGDEVLGGRH